MIVHGLPVFVALAAAEKWLGYERLGGLVREKAKAARCSCSDLKKLDAPLML
jgi:hypothetical protein